MNTLEFAERGSTLRVRRNRTMLTREQRDAIVAAYIAGKSCGVLARKYKISRNYPIQLAAMRGYRRRRAS